MLYNSLKLIIMIIIVALFSGCGSTVQQQDPVPRHDTFKIESTTLNETRVINVWAPPNYESTKEPYPVLYMLDGGVKEDFPHIANTIAALVAQGDIAPLILVGMENTERRRDLTGPSQVEADAEIAPLSDGSTEFRKFIRSELFTEIEKKYRVTNQRAIVGESVAGLFIVETLLLDPTLFDIYLAIDPSLWWNNHYLVTEAPKLIKNLPNKKLKLWFAGSDASDIYQHTEKLESILKNTAPENLHWLYLPQPEEQHRTIFRATKEAAFNWGLWKKHRD